MASISTDSGHGGKKSVDSEIPLVPFIDLLLCCIMFLLVTAVWNQLARVEATAPTVGETSDPATPDTPTERFYVQVTHDGLAVLSSAGTTTSIESGEFADLAITLAALHEAHPGRRDLIVSPDDDVPYQRVIGAMDTARGAGFTAISMQPTP